MTDIKILQKFKMQDQSSRIMKQYNPDKDYIPRQSLCLRAVRKDAVCIDLKKSQGAKKAHYSNLQTCGSPWTCPICASKISEVRKNEVDELLIKTDQKYHVFVTYTVPHYSNQKCAQVKDLLMSSRRKMKMQKKLKNSDVPSYKELMEKYQLDGSVTTIEVTYGKNGWHVHSHELLIFKNEISEQDQQAFHECLYNNWVRALQKNKVEIKDFQALKKYAVQTDFIKKDGSVNRFSDYLLKICKQSDLQDAWGIACELSKSHLKTSDHTGGKSRNITPFGMLAAMSEDKTLYSVWSHIFYEYAHTFKGARFLFFSKGLKKKYGIAEIADKDIVESQDILADYYGFFEKSEWKKIKQKKLRGWVIENSDKEFNEMFSELREKIR